MFDAVLKALSNTITLVFNQKPKTQWVPPVPAPTQKMPPVTKADMVDVVYNPGNPLTFAGINPCSIWDDD